MSFGAGLGGHRNLRPQLQFDISSSLSSPSGRGVLKSVDNQTIYIIISSSSSKILYDKFSGAPPAGDSFELHDKHFE